MNWQTVRVIFGNELRMLLCYRRTIIVAIVLPLHIYPLMFFATKTTADRREQSLASTVYEYAITGSQAEQVRELIATGAASTAQKATPNKNEKDSLADFKFREVKVQDPSASLKSAEIHFYLEGVSGEGSRCPS
ncbi:MAG: hypothetical protein ABSH28_08845 [Acidobacteriota bacterium]|jgi:hypothetical protein